MRFLFLLVAIFFYSFLAYAQGAHFHGSGNSAKADYFSYTDDDPTNGIFIRIQVTKDKIWFMVYNKSKSILSHTYNTDPSSYNEFLIAVQACNVKRKPAKKSDECISGARQVFNIKARINEGSIKFNRKFDGLRIKCSGYEYSNLQGDVDKMVEAFKLMVPNYDAKMDSIKTLK